MLRILVLSLAAASAPIAAKPFTVERIGQSFYTLAAAVDAIGDGSDTIRIAPGRYIDCAVQSAGRITYRAERPLTAIFDGGICEGKATLVLRGRGAAVEGLIFENLNVPEGNGAGIRIERGSLRVSRSIFRNSEQGILGGGDDPVLDISIDRTTFSGLGRCDRGLACAHSVYLGGYRSVTIRRSRFEKGRGGHYVKSRAARIEINDSSFDDSEGRATNYMIDLPEGARGRIERNIFVQGADKENRSAFIAVATEAQRNSSENLLIAHNGAHQVHSAGWPSALIVDWSGSPKQLAGNRTGAKVGALISRKTEAPTITGRVKGKLRYFLGWFRGQLAG